MNRLFLGAVSLLFGVGLACGSGVSEVSNTEISPKSQEVSEGPDDPARSDGQSQSRSAATPSQQLETPTLASFSMRQLAPGFMREGEHYEIAILVVANNIQGIPVSRIIKGPVKLLQVDDSGWVLLEPVAVKVTDTSTPSLIPNELVGAFYGFHLFKDSGEPAWVNLSLVLAVSELE